MPWFGQRAFWAEKTLNTTARRQEQRVMYQRSRKKASIPVA